MKFELYYPVSPVSVNQPFGNVMAVYTAMGLKGHNGIDFMAYHGQPIYAAHDGKGKVQVIGSIFRKESYAIALPNGSPYRKPINNALLLLQENYESFTLLI